MGVLDGLRGLFGSSGRQYVNSRPNDLRVEAERGSTADRQLGNGAVLKRMPILTPDLETPKQERAQKLQVLGATLQDMGQSFRGGQGGSLSRVQEGWRRRAAQEQAQAQMAQMQGLAGHLYGDDPEAQLLFMADPESFVKARAERFKPQTMSGGQTYFDPATGQRVTAPTVEKMDDRFGFYDPETGEARYSEARGPTFEEQGQQQKRLADIDAEIERLKVARGQLAVSQGNLGMRGREFDERKRQGGFGTPGGQPGTWEEF